VRLDVDNKGLLGNLDNNTLEGIWTGNVRHQWLQHHIKGNRSEVPACANCTYYGIPATPE